MKSQFTTTNNNSIPELLLNPPGLVGDICRFILNGSDRRQPLFALASALLAVGTAYARYVYDELGNMTNLFFLAVGHSGVGKEWPLKSVYWIFRAIQDRVPGYRVSDVHPGDVTSLRALEDSLSLNPALTLVIDDCGTYLPYVRKPLRRGSASVNRFLNYARFWRNGGIYRKSMIDSPVRALFGDGRLIKNPWLSFYGSIYPHILKELIRPDMPDNGILPCMTVFASDVLPPLETMHAKKRDVPDSIATPLADWYRYLASKSGNADGPALEDAAEMVPASQEANSVFEALRTRTERKCLAPSSGNAVLRNVYSHVEEDARRIALVVALGKASHPKHARVDTECAEFGCVMAEYLADVMLKKVNNLDFL